MPLRSVFFLQEEKHYGENLPVTNTPITDIYFMRNATSPGMILVFKTTVTTSAKINILKPHLDGLLPSARWNFDLMDCDNILRVNSSDDLSTLIISTLNKFGFDCIALD